MDASAYFGAAFLGLLGFIVGDIQRELRFRRDARAAVVRDNLNRSAAGPVADYLADADRLADAGTVPGSNGHGDSDSGTSGAVRGLRDGQARRRAVSRPDFGNRPASAVRGRRSGVPAAQTLGAGYDCG